MNVLDYDSIELPEDILRLEREIIQNTLPQLINRYSADEETKSYARMALSSQLGYILWALSGELKNKVILDLGCGSNKEWWEENRRYEPWLCRALHILGAEPIGIDFGDLEKEEFKHYDIDLDKTDLEKLKCKYNNSVDLANTRLLFSSPKRTAKEKALSHKNLKDNLIFRLEKILKPEGYFIYLKESDMD